MATVAESFDVAAFLFIGSPFFPKMDRSFQARSHCSPGTSASGPHSNTKSCHQRSIYIFSSDMPFSFPHKCMAEAFEPRGTSPTVRYPFSLIYLASVDVFLRLNRAHLHGSSYQNGLVA